MKFGEFYETWFLRHCEAQIMMSDEETRLSEERSEKYKIQFEAYRHRMKEKYGIDGGPTPAIIFGEPFEFIP